MFKVTMSEDKDFKKQRKVGKAAVLPTAPAYTWGKARQRIKDDPGPGPGEYSVEDCSFHRKGKGFGSGTRYKPSSDEVPGPGNYGIPRDPYLKSHPMYTFRGVTPTDPKAKIPGPGTYDSIAADKVSIRPSTASYSMPLKLEDPAMKEIRPGPQTYRPDLCRLSLDSKPAVSLKFRHNGIGKFAKDPGPGPLGYMDKVFLREVYSPGNSTQKGFTFGMKTKYRTTADITPGPIYKIGVTTLGISASVPMTDHQLNQIAIL
ncbi:hypothetical protein CEUSTIGMA_g9902.t1 [Chlamydomonas eustigma]|uniref:Outer dense fiber protein 3 n=1 Tax=Chlamydomonas eustigma TaxID=1157962 RepID=A0A250XHB8_9CHLO|nr:hypothetical protein CEUSTIGMA_g9902.t1 [Chlamydomonas eustigma]|eukprot:GAX82475.1 hypothetical protein CEUSTIGMA_g9902.t1 [Chlamydomonas eustigma]